MLPHVLLDLMRSAARQSSSALRVAVVVGGLTWHGYARPCGRGFAESERQRQDERVTEAAIEHAEERITALEKAMKLLT